MASISHFTPCSTNVVASESHDLCVIGFKPGENLCFQGQAAICALQGSFTLLGHTLSSPNKKFTGNEPVHFYPAFSPKAYSLLMIESTPYDKRGYRDTPSPQPSAEIKKDIVKITKQLLQHGPFETIVAIKGIQWCGIDGITSVVPMFKGLFKLFNPNRTEDLAGLTPSKRRKVIQNHPELLEYEFKVPGFYPILGVPNTPWMRTPESWVDGVQRLINGAHVPADAINSVPIIVVCGTKGVGKSTFTRFLSNSLLNEYKDIAYLECDIGQSEFTPNGLVSLNLVSNPVFGPPFTHLQKPYRSYFIGNTTPRDDPGYYMACIRELVNVYRQELACKINSNGEEIKAPLVINTQGWVKNMGLELLFDLLEYVAPTHIFQFHSPNVPYRNIPTDLPSKFVDEMETPREAKIILLSSVDDITPKYHASDLRTLNLISYLYMNPLAYQDAGHKSVWDGSKGWWDFKYPLIARPPYKIGWKHLQVSVLFDDVPYSQLLYALNSSVVALTGPIGEVADKPQDDEENGNESENDEGPMTPPAYSTDSPDPTLVACHGLAILRSISPQDQEFHILTPLPAAFLESGVTGIVKGNLDLPVWPMIEGDVLNHVMGRREGGFEKVESEVQVPYLTYEANEGVGNAVRKVRRNIMRRRLNGEGA
ncbi:hypothetical protein K493DRAFT_338632 [Basidiobolus meristosporus CBS 931.73]|uniref:Polynucleotide 5'-hydroxyl-kinase GRC3 n=1 Tax=Basidiobolus meristosporus CBS 931.73 TaxID=1314790 RepID=A0A1Y1Y4E5_9FUNG|nr:hypothetical protein K493DRAFT_338632 [Basidiobolus meristosporus CBS 931.73]|eukprot:ORX92775.1 hypothetical protein K493DRAFT_338632 [Basidiobolus meristosporus CBS 931.73]